MPNAKNNIFTDEIGSLGNIEIPQFSSDASDAYNFYMEYGFHIEYNSFSDKECDDLITASYELEEAKQGVFRPQMMPHRQDPIFLEAVKNPNIVAIMEKIIGEGKASSVAGLQSTFFFSKPSIKGFAAHQDNFHVRSQADNFASAWSTLTDVTIDKGAMFFYPGTHKSGLLPVEKIESELHKDDDPNANEQQTIVPPEFKPCGGFMPKGSTLSFNGYLVHGSYKNTTDENRYVLLNTYIRRGAEFRAGYYAKREEIDLYH